jgi:hypothetical protein
MRVDGQREDVPASVRRPRLPVEDEGAEMLENGELPGRVLRPEVAEC